MYHCATLTSFLLLLLDVTVKPSAYACHLKIFVCSGCFLRKKFKKCSKTLKPDWLPSNVFLLKVSPVWGLVKCTSAWHSLCGCQVCWRASWISRKCNLLQSVPWRLLFHWGANIFWEHCSPQTSCQGVESGKADGLYKNSFPLHPVLLSSSDPESYQGPKESRINNYSGCSTVVLAPLLVFHLLTVPVLSFSCVFHCSSFPSHPGQDFYCASKSVPGAYVLCVAFMPWPCWQESV